MFHHSIKTGRRNSNSNTCLFGVDIGCMRMRNLEYFLLADPDLKSFFRRMFFVWDGKHKLQTWLPYINHLHDDEPSWHIFIDSIVLDTSHDGLVELLTTMTKFNKYVLKLTLFWYIKLNLNDFVIIIFCISTSWWSWTT